MARKDDDSILPDWLEDLLSGGPMPKTTPRPGSGPKLDEGGIRIVPPTRTDKMSKTAMKGKDKAKGDQARLRAIKALRGLIPASPTR